MNRSVGNFRWNGFLIASAGVAPRCLANPHRARMALGFNPSAKRAAGFTLIEMLLGITLSSLVIVSAYLILTAVIQTYRVSLVRGEAYENARAAMLMMEKDLAAAFLSPNREGGTNFQGLDEEEEGVSMDRLTYMTVNHRPQYSGIGESDMAEVEYYIDTDSDTPEQWLQRRKDPTPDDDPFDGGVTHLLGENIVALDFQYFDGTEWVGEWDSKDSIPVAVQIGIASSYHLKNREKADFVILTSVVYLGNHRAKENEESS